MPRLFEALTQLVPHTTPQAVCSVLLDRFNISPLSFNISTREFSLLASPPKVSPEKSLVKWSQLYLLIDFDSHS